MVFLLYIYIVTVFGKRDHFANNFLVIGPNMLLGRDISFLFFTTGFFGPSPTSLQNLKMTRGLKVHKNSS